jgi:hypothetical protein
MSYEVQCPLCGSETRIRTRREDGSKFYVCVNWPDCKGKIVYDEEWEDDGWDDEKPVARAPKRTEKPQSRPKKRLKYTQSAKFYFLITFIVATVIGVAICWGQWKPEVDIASRLGYCLGYSMPIGLVVALIVYGIAKALGR